MSARAIVSGVLHKAPETKVSKNGNSYARATIRDGKGDDANWWACLIFSAAAVEEVHRLEPGDPIAVAGEIKAAIYTPPGKEPRVNLTIMVDNVLSARKPPKATPERTSRKRKEAKGLDRAEASNTGGRSIPSKSWASPEPISVGGIPFEDSIPFFPEWR
jgi:single-stranded DNA-binding protein